ncbi:MAG TPA: hypothetical protein VFA55_10390 [Candidatus Kapabacteria bacterium]|nr:hypothetical protein [Candidatus Kapabacteria bacterium]
MMALCGIARASNDHSRFKRVLSVDTVQDAKGNKIIRIQYTDIVVRVTDSGWFPQDSMLFYSERTKVEWASKILLEQISREKDSLSHFVDSAGARISRGAFTQKQVDSVVARMTTDIQQKVTTQEYALKRLDDYRHVSDAVKKILKRENNE